MLARDNSWIRLRRVHMPQTIVVHERTLHQAALKLYAIATPYPQSIVTLLRRPVPTAGLPEDNTEKEKSPWWKLRKWTLRISLRLISRYGDPKITRSDNSLPFSKFFLDEFSAEFLKVRPPHHPLDRAFNAHMRAAFLPELAPTGPRHVRVCHLPISACTHTPGSRPRPVAAPRLLHSLAAVSGRC